MNYELTRILDRTWQWDNLSNDEKLDVLKDIIKDLVEIIERLDK